MALVLGLSACSAPAALPQAATDKEIHYTPAKVEDTTKALTAENDKLLVALNKDDMILSVTDKTTGYRYDSAVSKDKLTYEPNQLWSDAVKALVSFTCVNSEKKSNDTLTCNNQGEKVNVTAAAVKSGFEVKMDFTVLKIKIFMQFLLKDDRLEVVIPDGSIVESGKYRIVDITPLPFLGHARDTDDGYFLYPNGSGEIFRFKDKSLRQNSVKEYILPIYCPFGIDMESRYTLSEFDREESQIMIPAYGVKIGSSGFAAVLEKGDADASIHVVPGGVGVAVNRINASFTYRHQYQTEGAGLNISGGMNKFPLAQMYDKEMIAGDRVISYSFLSGDQADYSGMAQAVRKNMIGRGALPESRKDENMPISLDYFMGISQKQLIFNEFITTTSFKQAQNGLATLQEQGVKNIFTTLKGWEDKGYGSRTLQPAARELGGAGDLKQLAEYCRQNKMVLFADVNLLEILKGNTSYSASADTAKDQNGFVYQDSGEKHLLFGPRTVWQRNQELLTYFNKVQVMGTSFKDIGSFIYSDFSKNKVTGRRQTMEIWRQLLAASKKELGAAASEGGNAYVLRNADVVKNIRETSESVLFSDETVPFYQMVIHSSVLYTGAAVNLYHDEKIQFLKMVEYGYMPRFELTHERSVELRDTEYNCLFSSHFNNWEKRVVNLYTLMEKDFSNIWNQPMTAHSKLADDVYCTRYSDGTAVYVNYGDKVFNENGVSVQPKEYTVLRGDAA